MNNPYAFATGTTAGFQMPNMNVSMPNTTVMPTVQASLGVSPPHMEIAEVSGIESAYAFVMGPNSSVILKDRNKPLVYFVITDASSFKTVTPYTLSEYVQEQPITSSALEARFEEINRRFDSIEERMKNNANRQSNYKPSWSNKSTDNEPAADNASVAIC